MLRNDAIESTVCRTQQLANCNARALHAHSNFWRAHGTREPLPQRSVDPTACLMMLGCCLGAA
eukprot:98614-Lingulodinium_polyedra.AAC.1